MAQLATLFLGAFLMIAGVVSIVGVRRLLVAAAALPFITFAAVVVTVALWVFVL
jgi:hypothetical protein